MTKIVDLYFGAALDESRGKGSLSMNELLDLEPRMLEAEKWLQKGLRDNLEGFGWLGLPFQDPGPILEQAEWLSVFGSIIQIGIGGSALGNRMLNNALLHPYYNELPREQRKGPKFFIADNVDPEGNHAIWDMVDPEDTALVVVSKSGSTAETMANFMFFFGKMSAVMGTQVALERVLVITDPEKGTLRPFSGETGCRSLEIPQGVGGRYSVLSSVGLLSAASMGINVRELLRGAAETSALISGTREMAGNSAWIAAGLYYLHGLRGRSMDVFMPYADGLENFVEWFAQLWAESIGKDGKGFTPVRALGAIDQHSQVQLYTEGPDDKLFTILDIRKRRQDIRIPGTEHGALVGLNYMKDKNMSEMITFEARSTAAALYRFGKPVLWLELPELNAFTLGGLIFFYEYVTALTGYLLSIEPFDQPGVEQGKKYTYGLMGREGFSEQAREAEELFAGILKQKVSL
ncbi:MAG: glucose-6-phosphate isomerase [Synergistales bacterium]|nr:glucose-6-phosphate isomerase [Synergistales bacterium]